MQLVFTDSRYHLCLQFDPLRTAREASCPHRATAPLQANEFITNAEATEAVFRGDAEGIDAGHQFPSLAALPGGDDLGRSDFREAVAWVRGPHRLARNVPALA